MRVRVKNELYLQNVALWTRLKTKQTNTTYFAGIFVSEDFVGKGYL